MNPAFDKTSLHDIVFDLLNGDCGLIDSEHARSFTRCGTNAPGEFREVIGGVQLADRFSPTSAIDEIIPVGNQIVDGASRLAKGNATIHAARALRANFLFRK